MGRRLSALGRTDRQMDGRSLAQGACQGSPQLRPGCHSDPAAATPRFPRYVLRHSLNPALDQLRKRALKSTPLALLEGKAALPRRKMSHGPGTVQEEQGQGSGEGFALRLSLLLCGSLGAAGMAPPAQLRVCGCARGTIRSCVLADCS